MSTPEPSHPREERMTPVRALEIVDNVRRHASALEFEARPVHYAYQRADDVATALTLLAKVHQSVLIASPVSASTVPSQEEPFDMDAPIDVCDALDGVRSLILSEAGPIAYFDDELNYLVAAVRKEAEQQLSTIQQQIATEATANAAVWALAATHADERQQQIDTLITERDSARTQFDRHVEWSSDHAASADTQIQQLTAQVLGCRDTLAAADIEIAALQQQIDTLTTERHDLRQRLEDLEPIGEQMSTLWFNLAQRTSLQLDTTRELAVFDSLRRQWDAAYRRHPQEEPGS